MPRSALLTSSSSVSDLQHEPNDQPIREVAATAVSHLRRSGLLSYQFPPLPRWANLCRAYGAGSAQMEKGRRDAFVSCRRHVLKVREWRFHSRRTRGKCQPLRAATVLCKQRMDAAANQIHWTITLHWDETCESNAISAFISRLGGRCGCGDGAIGCAVCTGPGSAGWTFASTARRAARASANRGTAETCDSGACESSHGAGDCARSEG